MTEAELQKAVIRCARLFGWTVAHFRPAQTQTGRWVTAVEADGKGYPDLTLAHPKLGIMWRELKGEKGRLTPEQETWLEVLGLAGGNVGVWRPRDWHDGTIERELRGL